MYVNAPVLARDNAFGWFPAQIVKVNDVKGTLKIHYNGTSWLGFGCPLRPCFPSCRACPSRWVSCAIFSGGVPAVTVC